jgi:hypothetical protein
MTDEMVAQIVEKMRQGAFNRIYSKALLFTEHRIGSANMIVQLILDEQAKIVSFIKRNVEVLNIKDS